MFSEQTDFWRVSNGISKSVINKMINKLLNSWNDAIKQSPNSKERKIPKEVCILNWLFAQKWKQFNHRRAKLKSWLPNDERKFWKGETFPPKKERSSFKCFLNIFLFFSRFTSRTFFEEKNRKHLNKNNRWRKISG